jgi:nucleoside-diphosphate-sugar epimerase
MNCLLTGSNGFLGQALEFVLSNNAVIHTLSRSGGAYIVDLEKQVPVFSQKFDLVIHAAGKAHSTPKSSEERDTFFSVNVQGTINLLMGLEKNKLPKSFIFISTVAVYGLNEGALITEDAPLLAKDPYGLSKIQAENLVQEWCKEMGVMCSIFRLPLIVGPNPPGNLGVMIKGIQKGYYFNIDGGKARKSMVLGEDVAKFILNVAGVGGIYNLTDGYHPNLNELSQLIAEQSAKAKVSNMPLVLAKLAAKIGDLAGKYSPLNTDKLNKITSTLTFDDSKARAAFGWNPTPVLEGFKITK